MTPKFPRRPLAFLLPLLLLASCQPFGSFDNPADPKASNYQGYLTVTNADEIAIVYPAAGGTFDGITLTLTPLVGAIGYEVAVAASEAGLATASAASSITSKVDISAANLADTTAYWAKARVKSADGIWGSWTAALRFTTAYSPAATPSFDPAGGVYSSTQPVTITCVTVGATIFYTSDGSDPASSATRLSGASPRGPVTASLGTTIRAIATASGYSQSAEGTASYKETYAVGDTGPAGGIVFYDKGSVSDGWRYLEAAPSDQSAGIRWYNGTYISVSTGTAIGSGKANTAA
ncbi:MAG: chitobiase/beta-hexosaminidase C-terminal domain-containing protein, partial [Spirochaetota bacterium]